MLALKPESNLANIPRASSYDKIGKDNISDHPVKLNGIGNTRNVSIDESNLENVDHKYVTINANQVRP